MKNKESVSVFALSISDINNNNLTSFFFVVYGFCIAVTEYFKHT